MKEIKSVSRNGNDVRVLDFSFGKQEISYDGEKFDGLPQKSNNVILIERSEWRNLQYKHVYRCLGSRWSLDMTVIGYFLVSPASFARDDKITLYYSITRRLARLAAMSASVGMTSVMVPSLNCS